MCVKTVQIQQHRHVPSHKPSTPSARFPGALMPHHQRSWPTCTARRWRGRASRSAPRLAIIHAKQQNSVDEGKRHGQREIYLVSMIPRVFHSRAPQQAWLVHVRRRCNDRGAWRARRLAIRPRQDEIHESLSAKGYSLTRIIQPSWGCRRQTAAGRGIQCAQNPCVRCLVPYARSLVPGGARNAPTITFSLRI